MNDSRLRFEDEELLKDVIMLAGQVLSEAGAEGTRIEGTMDRIAHHYGYTNCNSFATNTVINFSLHKQSYPRVFRIKKRNTNLSKISKTNEISRKIAENKITIQDAYENLKVLESHTESHSLHFKTFASAMIGFSFLYLQGGRLSDVVTVMIAAALGYLVTEGVSKAIDVFFIANFLGSVVIGLVAVIGNYFMPHTLTSVVIISAVMPIVPGVLITNAIQDLLVGNMMMFLTKTLEAAVTAFAIGSGVATVLYIF